MATLRPIDGSYVLDWRDRDGVRHRDTLGRVGVFPKKRAEALLRQIEIETSPGYLALNPKPVLSLGGFGPVYLAWHANEYPASHYRVAQIVADYLLPEFEHWRLDAIAPKQVDAWKHKRLAAGAKSQTVIKELRTLKAILNKAVEWREITASPIEHVAAPRILDSKPPRYYTAAELGMLYGACRATVNGGEGPQPNPQHAHWWRLYANTGLRRTEGLILKRAWVGQEAMKVLSTEEDRTKSGKWREIPLTVGAQEALDGMPLAGEYVMPRITLPSLSRAFKRDADRGGLDGSLHTLRHTYCSHLVMAGVPLRTVQQLLGHSTIAVTEHYVHLAPGHLAAASRSISL